MLQKIETVKVVTETLNTVCNNNVTMTDMLDISGSRERYAVCMLLLEEEAGLTYREARAILHHSREEISDLAKIYGITEQGVYNMIRRAEKKIRDSGKTQSGILGEYAPDIFNIDPMGVGEE